MKKKKKKAAPAKKKKVAKVAAKKTKKKAAPAKKKAAPAKKKAAPAKKKAAPAKKKAAPTKKKTAAKKKIGSRNVSEDTKNKARAKVFAKREAKKSHTREDGGKAFVDEATGSSKDEFATEMARDFLVAAETGKEILEELSDEEEDEEKGGPFTITTGGTEFAGGTDESNPEDADREPFPTTGRTPR